MVSSMGYLILSGNIQVERQETHFLTCGEERGEEGRREGGREYTAQQFLQSRTYFELMATVEYRIIHQNVVPL